MMYVRLARREEREIAAGFGEAYARYAARTPAFVPHPARLRRHFDDDAIIELTALVAFQNLLSKFNAALGAEPQGFCHATPQPKDARGPRRNRAKKGRPCLMIAVQKRFDTVYETRQFFSVVGSPQRRHSLCSVRMKSRN